MKIDQAKQLKELRRENERLKQLLADAMLGQELLKEALAKKVVSLGHKRQVVQSLVVRGRCTVRTVCRHFGLHRSTFRYVAKQPNVWLAKLKTALRRVSNVPTLSWVIRRSHGC